jgi:hypothetical protein
MRGLLPFQNTNPASPSLPSELTGEMFHAYCKVVEMVLAVRLSLFQKASAKQILRVYFLQGNAKGIRSVQEALDLYRSLMAKGAQERAIQARQILPHMIEEVYERPQGQEAEAKWLRGIYHAAHPVVSPGNPPLTRDVVDAWVSTDHFLRAQIWGQNIPQLTPSARARYDRKIAARWKTFPKEKRYRYMGLSGELLELKRQWPRMTPSERLRWKQMPPFDAVRRDILLEAAPKAS